MHRLIKIAAFTGIAFFATATAASASVTINDAGYGFVGKGDVQTALGWNNQMLQKNAEKLMFITTQPAAQALSQDATQDVTQAATKSVSRDVTCTVTTGNDKNPKVFHNDGTRSGSRDGSRDGDRSGSRAGALNGTVSYAVDYDARKANQFTGFNLKGQAAPTFAASGAAVFGDTSFGDTHFGGDWSFGDTEWGGSDAAPGDNPADCLSGNENVTDLHDVTTESDMVPGDIEYGDIKYGDIKYGAVTPTGPAALFVNGVSLPITPAAVPVA